MTGNAVAVINTSLDPIVKSRAVSEMRAIRSTLKNGTAEDALKAALYAEAVATAAKTQKAYTVFIEAAETQIRAERRIGEFLKRNATIFDSYDLGASKRGLFISLAEIPQTYFERAIRFFLDRGNMCAPSHVIRKAKEFSLERVEPGIGRDFTGIYWVQGRTNRLRTTHSDSLDDARRELAHANGLKKKWDRSARAQKIDALHGEARKFAQAITIARGSERGEVNAILGEAELLQAKVAEKLFDAWRAMQTSAQRKQHKPVDWKFDLDDMKQAAERAEKRMFTAEKGE